jgi:hypothetical protein
MVAKFIECRNQADETKRQGAIGGEELDRQYKKYSRSDENVDKKSPTNPSHFTFY